MIVHEWNEPALVARLGRHRRPAGATGCCSTTRITARVTEPGGDGRATGSRATTACSRSARCCARSICAAAGRGGSGPGTRRPTSRCSARCRASPQRARSGLDRQLGRRRAHGRARRSSCSSRSRPRPAGARSMACATRTRRCAAAPAGDRRSAAGCPITGCRRPSPRHRVTVHVPRRPYAQALPGIPTIRVFEALACGIPLVSAPWDDVEGLFRPGEDFLIGAGRRRRCARRCGAVLHEPGARGGARRARPAHDPGAPHLRAPGRRAARDLRASSRPSASPPSAPRRAVA